MIEVGIVYVMVVTGLPSGFGANLLYNLFNIAIYTMAPTKVLVRKFPKIWF
jgi:hypothetical protein